MSNKTIKESDKLYLTDNLFYINDKLYHYNEVKDTNTKINYRNWHKYLSDYGWSKLEWGWKRRLKNYSNSQDNNFRFGILDCGSNGDCLFHVIAEALNSEDLLNCPYDVKTLRALSAQEITDNNKYVIVNTS